MGFRDAQWRKSSFSSGSETCVEIAYPDWRKSTFSSETADCVEIAYTLAEPTVGIRDSKNPAAGHLTVPESALLRLVVTTLTA